MGGGVPGLGGAKLGPQENRAGWAPPHIGAGKPGRPEGGGEARDHGGGEATVGGRGTPGVTGIIRNRDSETWAYKGGHRKQGARGGGFHARKYFRHAGVESN